MGVQEAMTAEDGGNEVDDPPQVPEAMLKKDHDPNWLRLCLEALKETGTMYMPLRLMKKTGVLHTILKLRTYPDECIAR